MTPAEELIKAAARIREVADKATPGPWESRGHLVTAIAAGTGIAEPFWGSDSDHIALLDPIVAEAVAKLLANAADALRTASGRAPSLEQSEAAENWYRHELAVARAVNSKAASDA